MEVKFKFVYADGSTIILSKKDARVLADVLARNNIEFTLWKHKIYENGETVVTKIHRH